MERFAAVDIGSNAVRLFFCDIGEKKGKVKVKKLSLIRLPIRLGEDVFSNGRISEDKAMRLVAAMDAFSSLVKVYGVSRYRVCATSAMRDAKNGKELIKKVRKDTGIQISLINGKEEAALIHATGVAENFDDGRSYLYVDVGGGSTELTLFSNGFKRESESFKIGTIRLKNEMVQREEWGRMVDWLVRMSEKYSPRIAIGTGGNINRYYKMCGLSNYAPLMYGLLKQQIKFVGEYSYEERIEVLGLKPDRADVILHAGKIYATVMKQAKIKVMHVPKVGLADGIVMDLYRGSQK